MTDLVKRLRDQDADPVALDELALEAADHIEQLEKDAHGWFSRYMDAIGLMRQALAALESCTPGDYSTGHVVHPSYDEAAVQSAIAALQKRLEVPC